MVAGMHLVAIGNVEQHRALRIQQLKGAGKHIQAGDNAVGLGDKLHRGGTRRGAHARRAHVLKRNVLAQSLQNRSSTTSFMVMGFMVYPPRPSAGGMGQIIDCQRVGAQGAMTAIERGIARPLHCERLAGAHVPRGATTPDQRLEQAVGSQAILAVNAVAGRLARGVELGHRGAAVLVDPHAAHKVVLRGRDLGWACPRCRDRPSKAARANVGKVPGHHVALDGGKAQPLVLGAVLLHLLANSGGDHIARLELIGKALPPAALSKIAPSPRQLSDQEGAARLRREQPRGVNLHVVQVLHLNDMLLEQCSRHRP